MSDKSRPETYEDPKWGVHEECGSLVLWPGKHVECDECEGGGEYVPSDETGHPLKPKKRG